MSAWLPRLVAVWVPDLAECPPRLIEIVLSDDLFHVEPSDEQACKAVCMELKLSTLSADLGVSNWPSQNPLNVMSLYDRLLLEEENDAREGATRLPAPYL